MGKRRSPARPRVALLIGSDSDLEVVRGALEVLDEFRIPHELRVLSAHRTPKALREFIERSSAEVFIAAAGGAAHLAGAVAAETIRPVIALPVPGKSLEGLDSLLSMVQMPPGIPVACVGIGAGRNAGLLAVQILAVSDPALAGSLREFRRGQTESVLRKDKELRDRLKAAPSGGAREESGRPRWSPGSPHRKGGSVHPDARESPDASG